MGALADSFARSEGNINNVVGLLRGLKARQKRKEELQQLRDLLSPKTDYVTDESSRVPEGVETISPAQEIPSGSGITLPSGRQFETAPFKIPERTEERFGPASVKAVTREPDLSNVDTITKLTELLGGGPAEALSMYQAPRTREEVFQRELKLKSAEERARAQREAAGETQKQRGRKEIEDIRTDRFIKGLGLAQEKFQSGKENQAARLKLAERHQQYLEEAKKNIASVFINDKNGQITINPAADADKKMKAMTSIQQALTSGRNLLEMFGGEEADPELASQKNNMGALQQLFEELQKSTNPPANETDDEDAQAIEWAKSHPDDPRAKAILELHGQK